MCDPVTATAALAIASAGMGALNAYSSNKMNESIANANADQVRDTGFVNEMAFRDQARRDIASQAARLSTSGVALDTGSPLLLLAESARNKELDALSIRRNAKSQENAYRMQASAYNRAAPLSAAAQLLSGLSSFANAGGLGGGGGGAGGGAGGGGGGGGSGGGSGG